MTTNNFSDDIRYLIKKEPEGALIFDISLRYGSIETDIIRYAEYYGYDPEWTEEEKAIVDVFSNPDNYIEGIYDESIKAEEYLNSKLEDIGIYDYQFIRFSENEIWGLFPESAIDEYYGVN